MSIKLLLADDSGVIRAGIARLLKDEPLIELVGVATSFAETLLLTTALNPDVLLLDLHMHDEREYPPEVVKPCVLLNAKCVVAISIWNDADATALAESLGAAVLLDKTKLYAELIPTIKQHCPKVATPITVTSFGQTVEPAYISIHTRSAGSRLN